MAAIECSYCNIWGHEQERCGKKIASTLPNPVSLPQVEEKCGTSRVDTVLVHPSSTKGLVEEQIVGESGQVDTIEKHPQEGKLKDVIESIVDSGKRLNEAMQEDCVDSEQNNVEYSVAREKMDAPETSKKKQKNKKKQKQQHNVHIV